jgi:chromosome partitioning protein
MTTTITIANQKGGVGKTTTAVTLASGLVRQGSRVLLVDLDPQGQCATILGLKPESGAFNLLVAEQPLSQVMRSTDRPNLFVVLGDRKTAVAQTVLNVQRSPISFTNSKLVPCKMRGSTSDTDTSPSVGELQEQALWAANGVLIPCGRLPGFRWGFVSQAFQAIKDEFDWQEEWEFFNLYDSVTRESQATMQDGKRFSNLLEPDSPGDDLVSAPSVDYLQRTLAAGRL